MRYLPLIAFAALAACAEGEQVTTPPEGDIATSRLPVDPAAANRVAVTEPEAESGRWFTKTTDEGPWVGYGPPFGEAAFSVRCVGDQLMISTTEMPPSGPGQTEISLAAGGFYKTIPAEASEDGLPTTEAAVPAGSEWLSRLASASGDLAVRVGGSDPMPVPISDPLRSLIRDCGGSPEQG